MPRKPLPRDRKSYYHITVRSNDEEGFYVSHDQMWSLLTQNLRLLQIEYDLKIAVIFMIKNQFYLLLSSPKEDIGRIMYFLNKKLSFEIRKKTGRINRIFGGRYKGCLVSDESSFLTLYKYFYRMPILAGLCVRGEEYPFNSLKSSTVNSLSYVEFIPTELDWLNSDFTRSDEEKIRKALKKTILRISTAKT